MIESNETEGLLRGDKGSLQNDKDVRLGFVRKVFGILTAQLGFTAAFCIMAMKSDEFKLVLFNPTYIWPVIVMYFVSFCAIACCGLDKKVPVNYVLLFIFTACVSWMVGAACTRYDERTVIEATCLTTAICAGIMVYAMTTKNDFTIFGPVLFMLGFVFMTFGILFAVMGFHLNLIWATLGVILFGFYLLVDTQMIMGGQNKRYQFDEDSYILAAVVLYLDIINIFLYIL